MGKNLITLLFAFTLIASASWELDFDEDYEVASRGLPDITDSLVFWYRMDDNRNTTTVLDSSSFARNGSATANTDTLTTNGVKNTALKFNGTSNFISTGMTNTLAITSQLTLSIWVYSPSTITAVQLISKDVAGARDFTFDLENGKTRFYLQGGGTDISNTADWPPYNSWHHLAVTFNNRQVYIYQDGIQVASKTFTASTITISNTELTVGKRMYVGAQGYYKGVLDEARVYNRALTSNEVFTVYNKQKP